MITRGLIVKKAQHSTLLPGGWRLLALLREICAPFARVTKAHWFTRRKRARDEVNAFLGAKRIPQNSEIQANSDGLFLASVFGIVKQIP